MQKIVFVCWGNICRSPMAEFVMKDLAQKAGRGEEFEIESRAVSREEEGNGIHRGTRAVLDSKGIPYTNRYATVITKADYEYFDKIIVMDSLCERTLIRLLGGDKLGKVSKMCEGRDVADPWYTGNFDKTYQDILEGCKRLLNE